AVAPGLVRPRVAVDAEAEPAELAEHRGPARFGVGGARTRVGMNVVHVADLHVIPAAGTIDQPARVPLLRPARQPRGVVLAPALVENDPHDDAGVVVPPVEHPSQLELELPGRLRRAGNLALAEADAFVAAGHVLPDQEAQLIAPVIPAFRFDLDVLPRRVEA